MILVDSNVLLDVFNSDPVWGEWSASRLAEAADRETLAINPLIYAEVSLNYRNEEELDAALPASFYVRLPLPYEAAFLAGRTFLEYRQRGGAKRSPLPDFYIGAHAQVAGLTLLTRDATRYRTYFPGIKLIAPEE
jgi:predicted nucleic acid-binding protein